MLSVLGTAMIVIVKSWAKEVLGFFMALLRGVGSFFVVAGKTIFYWFTMCFFIVFTSFLGLFEWIMESRRERARRTYRARDEIEMDSWV
jgi:hypothetical protein